MCSIAHHLDREERKYEFMRKAALKGWPEYRAKMCWDRMLERSFHPMNPSARRDREIRRLAEKNDPMRKIADMEMAAALTREAEQKSYV